MNGQDVIRVGSYMIKSGSSEKSIETDSECAGEREYRWKSGKRTQNSLGAHGKFRREITKGSKHSVGWADRPGSEFCTKTRN